MNQANGSDLSTLTVQSIMTSPVVTIREQENIDCRQRHSSCSKTAMPLEGMLVVEDDIEEGAMHLETAVIFNETQLPKLVQKEADA